MLKTLIIYLRGSWRILAKELAAFGVVGFVGLCVDIGVFNLLTHQGVGVLTSKLTSTVFATSVAYVGNRYFSFSHRARTSLGRETSFFFGINAVILVFAELILALFAYPLGYKHDRTVLNIVNLGTIFLGTGVRFWFYKRFVFLHPDRVHVRTAEEDIKHDEEDSDQDSDEDSDGQFAKVV